jgi:hypothetical protein
MTDIRNQEQLVMAEYSAILNVLKQASMFDVFLVSFLLPSFVFQAWLKVLSDLAIPPKMWSLAAVLLLYAIGVVAMLAGSSRTKKREVAKNQVVAYIQGLGVGKKMVSFETIRERINSNCDDRFLESLTIAFPQELRRARLKGQRPGLAMITEEED